MFGLVRDQGLGVMAYSPLAVGLLSGIYSPDRPPPSGSLWTTPGHRKRFSAAMQGPSGEVVSTVIELAKELGRTPAQLAIAWVLSHPEVTVAITGGDTIDHLDDSLRSVGWTLDDSVRQKLDTLSAAACSS